MALSTTLVPVAPSVPPQPGVPSLASDAAHPVTYTPPLQATSDSPAVKLPPLSVKWGIYDVNAKPVIIPDSIVDFEFKNEKRISTAPQEAGGFVSYNKVSDPFSGKLKLSKGGTTDQRATFLSTLPKAVNSLDLYTIVTPEVVYKSVNLTHYDFKRDARSGVQLIQAEVWFEEVRIIATTTYSNTATPAGADPQNGGETQPAKPDAAQTKTVAPAQSQQSTPFTGSNATGARSEGPPYDPAGGPSPAAVAPLNPINPPGISPTQTSALSAQPYTIAPGMF